MIDNTMLDADNFIEKMKKSDIPARKAMLQYLVRAGSFTIDNAKRYPPGVDSGDPDVEFPSPNSLTWEELRAICEENIGPENPTLRRGLIWVKNRRRTDTMRVMTWNILSQALADNCDSFATCPKPRLAWPLRRWKIIQEIATMKPDILCLQEVDHYKFFEKALATVGLEGVFCPKPDSPCLYYPGNNGPDGCAIFINTRAFEPLDFRTKVLEVCGIPSNQVAAFRKIRRRSNGTEMWICSTHLKARTGQICKSLRREQTTDLVNFIRHSLFESAPMILCGDFNAKPNEITHRILEDSEFKRTYDNMIPIPFTTWTIRDDEEYAKILDYIYYRRGYFACESVIRVPREEQIGPDRIPSDLYPSDHFSLVANLITQ